MWVFSFFYSFLDIHVCLLLSVKCCHGVLNFQAEFSVMHYLPSSLLIRYLYRAVCDFITKARLAGKGQVLNCLRNNMNVPTKLVIVP